jgi:hypothetical protein
MSLEESMKDLAESNRELAAAMRNYAGVMQGIANKNPDHIVTPPAAASTTEAATTEAAAPPKGKGGRKSQADKDAAAKADVKAQSGEADPFAEGNTNAGEEEDPFADSSEVAASAPKIDANAIRGLILRVKSEKGDDAALKVLAHVGVKTLGQIKEPDYQKIVDFCARGGIKL